MHGLRRAVHCVTHLPPQRDSFYYSKILQSCSSISRLKQTHDQIVTSGVARNPFLAAKLISKYSDFDHLNNARVLFDETPHRDVLLWNVIIRGYANSNSPYEAVHIYARMRCSIVLANCYTYPFVLKACAAYGDDRAGRAVHLHTLHDQLYNHLFVGNALVAFYAKCGKVLEAKTVFDRMQVKDLVSWNSIIAGYSQNDHSREAIFHLYCMVNDDRVNRPDYVTLVTVLPACAAVAAVQSGMWVHSYSIKCGLELDSGLSSGLIGMYANCGHLTVARDVFDKTFDKNVIVFNAMIRAHGMHGNASQAVELFLDMLEKGIKPDGLCFITVLSACSHGGMVDKGREIFDMMEKYGVQKDQIHYACMVDMLGRAGELYVAVEFIESMPLIPEMDVWGALFGACRVHNNVELAEEVAKKLTALDPGNAGRYAALASMYVDAGRWEEASSVRKVMRDRGIRKVPGCSMVQVDSEAHMFGVGDESHSMTPEIYVVLKQLKMSMTEEENEDQEVVAASLPG